VSTPAARDHGIRQIRLLTKSLAAAGVVLAVALSVVVAKARPGAAKAPTQVSTVTPQPGQGSPTDDDGQGGQTSPSITADPNVQSNGGVLPPPVPLRHGHRGGSAVSGAS
jgi:hypothetical protein